MPYLLPLPTSTSCRSGVERPQCAFLRSHPRALTASRPQLPTRTNYITRTLSPMPDEAIFSNASPPAEAGVLVEQDPQLDLKRGPSEPHDMASFIAPACTSWVSSPWRRPPHTSKPAHPTHTAPVAIAESRPRPGVDFHGIPNPPHGSPLMLSDLRERLIRQEETIIFALIERAQFKQNPIIYTPGVFDLSEDCDGTFSQHLLYELEKVYARVRRYTSPDEQPFAPEAILPKPILGDLEYPKTLYKNNINVNARIEETYRAFILPQICEAGDDQNYGSASTCDVACLQALSKRIHYGKFIAEAKCQESESKYRELAGREDRDGIWEALSNFAVEEVLLKRVENKARSYGSDITVDGARDVYKVNPVKIAEIYRNFIIPLTKEVEVDYILLRYNTNHSN